MADRKGAAASRRDDAEFVDENESECKCEFLDARFLATVALDSEHAALDYFYQSPFYLKYRDKALNELIRAGQQVDSLPMAAGSAAGSFSVGNQWVNRSSSCLRFRSYAVACGHDAPTGGPDVPGHVQQPGRHQRGAEADGAAGRPGARAVLRERGHLPHHALLEEPGAERSHDDANQGSRQRAPATDAVQVYYIIQGSIFLCPPFGSLVRNRLHESIEHFEKFYDTLNDISAWSATNGYSWEPKPKALDPQIKALCDRYGFKEEHHEDFIRDGAAGAPRGPRRDTRAGQAPGGTAAGGGGDRGQPGLADYSVRAVGGHPGSGTLDRCCVPRSSPPLVVGLSESRTLGLLREAAAGAATAAAAALVALVVRDGLRVAAHVAGGEGATELPAAGGTLAVVTPARVHVGRHQLLEPLRNLLVGLLEQREQVPQNAAVLLVDQRSGDAHVARTPGTTDAVHVVVNVGGQVVVDHVCDVVDVEAPGGNVSGHEDGALASLEETQRLLAVLLTAVAVNGDGHEVVLQKLALDHVGAALGLDEDEHEAVGVLPQQLDQVAKLLLLVSVEEALPNELVRGADAPDGEVEVVGQKVARQLLDLLGEGGAEHHRLAPGLRHVAVVHDAADLRGETHIKHAIGFVQNQVFDAGEPNLVAVDEIGQTAGGRHADVAAAVQLEQLTADLAATVQDDSANARGEDELAGLGEGLHRELAGRREDQTDGVRLAMAVGGHGGRFRRARGQHRSANGQQEGRRLAGAGLGTRHQVAARHDDGNRVLLDGRRLRVVHAPNVHHEQLVDTRLEVLDRDDGVGLVASHLDGDVLVRVEVDAGVCAGVHLAEDVLLLLPDVPAATPVRPGRGVRTGVPAPVAEGAVAEAVAARVRPRIFVRDRAIEDVSAVLIVCAR
ncbi:mediator of RNA polymerase II transcription subunit 6 [Babesia caballi]|uniref:Mediator of RNA polymerase II transcription subunit 6 n=1 Tax=Babesia caballi TaxID=5871 RepID=A0AAV4LY63_BABCB|nr:mediator of RNA polymerase II transcription subunit 6 [Babesia caballi]